MVMEKMGKISWETLEGAQHCQLQGLLSRTSGRAPRYAVTPC